MKKLCLGTVQFGLDYGISNKSGQPTEREVAAILGYAVRSGVGYLDTATSYGDAETLIGRHLPRGHTLRIVTKLPPISSETVSRREVTGLLDSVKGSLDRLKTDRVYGLLIHHAADLAKPGGEAIAEVLQEFQASGLAEKIGVSAYDATEIALARRYMPMSIVQVPFNVLDRRLAEQGILAGLREAGVEVHARSVFLQGLLLMRPDDLPTHLTPVQSALIRLHKDWETRGLTPPVACLNFVLRHPDINVAVIGVNSLAELTEIEAAFTFSADIGDEGPVVSVPTQYLNPAQWQALVP